MRNITNHSHVLVYDWTNEGDVTNLIEDIETLNFDYEKDSKKMADWRFDNAQELRTKRQFFENRHYLHMDYIRHDYDVPELHFSPEQNEERNKLLETVCIYEINCLQLLIESHEVTK